MEVWKEYKGLYVSNMGRVVNDYQGRGFNPHLTKGTDNGKGYLRINYKSKNYKIHRLVGELFIPNPNNYPEIDHINRNTKDNRVDNLRWVNRSINSINRGINKNNTTGYKNISLTKEGTYRVKIIRNNKVLVDNRKLRTLEDAVEFRNRTLNQDKNLI